MNTKVIAMMIPLGVNQLPKVRRYCTSSLKHAGGSNGTIEDKTWKYRLFAYIVSEESDFPSEVTRLNLK